MINRRFDGFFFGGVLILAGCFSGNHHSEMDGGTEDTGPLDAGTLDGAISDAGPHDAGADCPTNATLQQVQATVFAGCGGFAPMMCHARDPYGADLSLNDGDSYSQLVNVPSQFSADVRVVPFHHEQSFLWRTLTNDLAPDGGEGLPMPSGEAIRWQMLPDEQMTLLRCWIDRGAQND